MSEKLKIYEFLDKQFHEIPDKENPAYNKEENLMIYKSPLQNAFILSYTTKFEEDKNSIFRLGVFFKVEIARYFADIFSENRKEIMEL